MACSKLLGTHILYPLKDKLFSICFCLSDNKPTGVLNSITSPWYTPEGYSIKTSGAPGVRPVIFKNMVSFAVLVAPSFGTEKLTFLISG